MMLKPIYVIKVALLEPNKIAVHTLPKDGGDYTIKTVGRRRGQRLLFESAVAGDVIHTNLISFGDDGSPIRAVAISVFARRDVQQAHNIEGGKEDGMV